MATIIEKFKTLEEIKAGECFAMMGVFNSHSDDHKIWMATNNEVKGAVDCVELESGKLQSISKITPVIPVIEVKIEVER